MALSLSKILVAGAAIVGISSASAFSQQTPDPHSLYRAVGVAAGETVPVYAFPGEENELAAELPASARDVVLTGATTRFGETDWHQIIVDVENEGWVEARYLQSQDDASGREEFPLRCLGTEPFWGLSADSQTARFSTPEIEGVDWTVGERRHASGLLGRFFLELASDRGQGVLAVTRAREYCTDNMSDTLFPYEALLLTPGEAVRGGCCRRAAEPGNR